MENWKKHWDDKQQSVYATLDDQWVGYDNQRSISLKVKWASSMMLGGTMLWTLDFDDYTGDFCNEGPFPLARAIKNIFDEFLPASTTITPAATLMSSSLEMDSTPSVSTTQIPNAQTSAYKLVSNNLTSSQPLIAAAAASANATNTTIGVSLNANEPAKQQSSPINNFNNNIDVQGNSSFVSQQHQGGVQNNTSTADLSSSPNNKNNSSNFSLGSLFCFIYIILIQLGLTLLL